RDVIVERDGARLEPISGQFVLNFDTKELGDKVRVMPERHAEDWFALALQYESDPDAHTQAIQAYQRVLTSNPNHIDALINVGMLFYEQGELESAAGSFLRAVAVEQQSAVAHFNLGSVLEELGQLEASRQHLRIAVRLDPNHADAHYNLAFVCDRLGSAAEARQPWQGFNRLAPTNPWATPHPP